MQILELEEKIKEFARGQGVQVVGIAGPESLDGPPSLDLDYTMRGAKSVVSMALPMDVDALYEFLGKRSPAPHNLDQFLSYQRLQRIGADLARYISSLGYRAVGLPLSADYRRALYVFRPRPAFSLRLGAIASGIAGLGWSGNVKTKEYGSAVYLGAVITDAALESDPIIPPRYFVDEFCVRCKRCVKACPSRMFEAEAEDYLLLNGHLLPRGRRRNIDLCHISCFGLHSLSSDKRLSNWGQHWIDSWVDKTPDPEKELHIIWDMLKRGLTTGDAAPRFEVLRRLCSILWPADLFEGIPGLREFPRNEQERYRILAKVVRRMGVSGIDDYPIPIICGQCALVCGPTLEETARRYRVLAEAGIVVPAAGGSMARVDSFEEAQAIRARYPLEASLGRKLRDTVDTFILWHRHYFGLEPRSIYQSKIYNTRLKKALRKAGGKAG